MAADTHKPTAEKWRAVPLGELVTRMANGTTALQNQLGVGLPVTRIETISNGHIDLERIRHVDVAAAELSDYGLVPGDILLSHINSVKHIGKVAQYDGGEPLYHGMNLMLLRLDTAKVDVKFGYYVLSSRESKEYFETNCKRAINQASLNRKDVGGLGVLLPPLPEQRKIAAILSSLDGAIEKTQAVIDQVQVVKKGLMQELLTRGLPGRHKKFKMTEIGEVPEEWEVAGLNELCEILHGFAFKGQYFTDDRTDWLLVTPGNFAIGGGFNAEKLRFYDGPLEPGYVLEPGELIVTMTDLSKAGDTLGYGALLPYTDMYGFLHNQRIGRVRIVAGDRVLREFLFRILCSASYRKFVLASASGTTVRHTSPTKILSYQCALPTVEEQAEIVKVLETFDAARSANERELESLRSIKSGLMSVLLTGEIRVTTDPLP